MGSAASKQLEPSRQWALLEVNNALECQLELKLVNKWPQKRSPVARDLSGKDKRVESQFYAKNRAITPFGHWEGFRRDNRNRQSASQSVKSPNNSFVVAEYHYNGTNTLIPGSLHIKLLNQLMRLSTDKTIQFDIRDAETGVYKKSGASANETDYQNAVIHDLIDPSKYLMDHVLWIPSVFHVDEKGICSIQSQILNLDAVKYKDVYRSIEQLFEKLIPCFENVENRKLGGNEKVIVKSLDYILQKQGDIHEGKKHFEGMGEFISSVAIFYPFVDSDIEGGDLNVAVMGFDGKWRNIGLPTKQGTVVVLSNECYHNLVKIEYPKKEDDAKRALSRKLIVMMLIEKDCQIPTTQSVDNDVVEINMQYNTEYILNVWCGDMSLDRLSVSLCQMIEAYICGNEEYVYQKRSTFRLERTKKSPSFFCMV